ncbi:MAG: DUF4065 domain-containing protein [Planctomycetaceae bacterium]|nr:DUF4065 domain-containing protein [Planctomycetaceae bacterium]
MTSNVIGHDDQREAAASGAVTFRVTVEGSVSRSGMPLPPSLPRKITKRNLTASAVAKRIIEFCVEHGDLVTNLKLQKLLYYMQAWHLALHSQPLFAEDFQAGDSGPVEPGVFSEYKEFAGRAIAPTGAAMTSPRWLEKHIEEVMEVYGRFSAFDLERMTKDEDPWKVAKHSGQQGEDACPAITKDVMRKYYKSKLPDEP